MSSLEASNLFSIKGMVFVITGGGSGMIGSAHSSKPLLTNFAGIGAMFANTLDVNGAAKVYILGRRMDKLQEVASAAVWNSIQTPFSDTHKM
jgi:hypothetical protein